MLKTILTEPSVEPVALAEAKAHLVVDHQEDDYIISRMIVAARKHIEQRCNRAIVRQKWRLYMDGGFSRFKLEPTMAQEVEAIYYLDTDGAEQTLSSSVYTVDIPRQCVYLAYNQSWPGTRTIENAVWADVWSGYYKTTASPIDLKSNIPEDIKYAVLLAVEDMYEHRGRHSEMQLYPNSTFDMLVQPHIVYA